MGSSEGPTVRDPQADPVCPACGQAVGTTIKRHKVLGAWVPVWEPQPCGNPDCELFGRKSPTAASAEAASGETGDAKSAEKETGQTETGQAETGEVAGDRPGKDDEIGRSQTPG